MTFCSLTFKVRKRSKNKTKQNKKPSSLAFFKIMEIEKEPRHNPMINQLTNFYKLWQTLTKA